MSSSINKIETDLQKGTEDRIEVSRTGRNVKKKKEKKKNSPQPALAIMHKAGANPSPLELLSFAACISIFSLYGVRARGIGRPNLVVGNLVFDDGICQFLAGIMEFVAGNMFGATVFPSYAASNLSFAMIWLLGLAFAGIYRPIHERANGRVQPGLGYVSLRMDDPHVHLTVAAVHSIWVRVINLVVLDNEFLPLACVNMVNNSSLLIGGNSLGFIVAFLSSKSTIPVALSACWAATAGLGCGIAS